MTNDDIQEKFDRLVRSNAIVATTVRLINTTNVPQIEALKACVVVLAEKSDRLHDLLAKAMAVAPCRYAMPDGQIVRYDAPDDVVPFVTLPPP